MTDKVELDTAVSPVLMRQYEQMRAELAAAQKEIEAGRAALAELQGKIAAEATAKARDLKELALRFAEAVMTGHADSAEVLDTYTQCLGDLRKFLELDRPPTANEVATISARIDIMHGAVAGETVRARDLRIAEEARASAAAGETIVKTRELELAKANADAARHEAAKAASAERADAAKARRAREARRAEELRATAAAAQAETAQHEAARAASLERAAKHEAAKPAGEA